MKLPNFGMVVASLLLSVSLFAYVKTQEALKITKSHKLKLVATGLDEDRYIARKVPSEIVVIAEGTPEQQEKFAQAVKRADAAAILDLRDATPDRESASYRPLMPRTEAIRAAGVSIQEVPDVQVVVEDKFRKSMDIEIQPGIVPEGFVYTSSVLRPDKVRLSGVKDELARVSRVVGQLDITDFSPAKSYNVKLIAQDAMGRTLSLVVLDPDTVLATPVLASAPPERSLVVSVVLARNSVPAPGHQLTSFSVEPISVTVTGPLKSLEKLRTIPTTPISVSGLKSSTVLNGIRLMVPPGVRVRPDRVRVRLTVNPIPPVVNPDPGAAAQPTSPGGEVKPSNTP